MTPIFFKAIHPPKQKPDPKEEPKEVADEKKGQKSGPEDLSHFHTLLGVLSEHRAGGDFGPHNIEPGHHVAFKAGSYSGSGKVCTTGRDGLTVQDEGSREHRVHWREVTGHFAPEKKAKSGK